MLGQVASQELAAFLHYCKDVKVKQDKSRLKCTFWAALASAFNDFALSLAQGRAGTWPGCWRFPLPGPMRSKPFAAVPEGGGGDMGTEDFLRTWSPRALALVCEHRQVLLLPGVPALQNEHESPCWLADGVSSQRRSLGPALCRSWWKPEPPEDFAPAAPGLQEHTLKPSQWPLVIAALQLCRLAAVLLVFVCGTFGSSVAITLSDMFSFTPVILRNVLISLLRRERERSSLANNSLK